MHERERLGWVERIALVLVTDGEGLDLEADDPRALKARLHVVLEDETVMVVQIVDARRRARDVARALEAEREAALVDGDDARGRARRRRLDDARRGRQIVDDHVRHAVVLIDAPLRTASPHRR